MSKTYLDFIARVKEISDLKAIELLLEWDQQTYIPPQGVKDSSLQLASLSTLTHERMTSKSMGAYLEELQRPEVFGSLDPVQQVNVREFAWEHHRAAAIPGEFVTELTKTKSESYTKWTEAKEKARRGEE